MKACSAQPKGHNLNIKMYSFRELLELFQLSPDISLEDIKRAKLMVLKMHPDKSRLPSEYFLFYKKAFDIVYSYYQEQSKTTAEVPTTEQTYVPLTEDKRTANAIQKTVKQMGQDQFQSKFNELFDSIVEKPKEYMNEWFKTNDPLFEFDEVSNTAGLGAAIEHVKQKTAALVQYTGVQSMNSGGPAYDHLYDNNETYVSCDPFGKLKYDDLRKVHKDQTVFSVSERDFDKVKKYSSMDHLQRERGADRLTPIEKTKAENILAEQEEEMRKRMLSRQHASQLQSMQYVEKNKNVLSAFLQLKN